MSASRNPGPRPAGAARDHLDITRIGWSLAFCLGLIGLALALSVIAPHARHLGIDYSVVVAGQVVHAGPRPSQQRPPFQYRYLFEGEIYRGTAFRVTGGTRQALDRYRPGDRIPVHVDPARPERALIQPGLVAVDCWQLGLAGGLLLVALWLAGRQLSS